MAEEMVIEKERSAPYLPFKTFLSGFDVFEHGLPTKIDRSMWRTQSGVLQGQIVVALRFFGLLDDYDSPKPALERFMAKKDQRKEHIGVLLQHSYRSILDQDMTKMTPRMLHDAFERFGVSGETRRKAIAFFLQAASYAELPMHPLLNRHTRTPNVSGRKRKKPSAIPYAAPGTTKQDTVEPSDANEKSIKLASGATVTLRISANWIELPTEERTFVFGLIDLLQAKSAPVAKKPGKVQEDLL